MQLKEQHKSSLTTFFGVSSALLSLLHFAVMAECITYAQQVDVQNEKDRFAIKDLQIQLVTAESVLIGILGGIQFFSCWVIVYLNCKRSTPSSLLITSLISLFCALGLGVYDATYSVNYGISITYYLSKSQTAYPSLVPFYYLLQADATTSLLLSVPMLFFVFYNSLESYLKKLRESKAEGKNCLAHLLLMAFVIDVGVHIALIINTYQAAAKNDPYNYYTETSSNPYTFYLLVDVIVALVVLISLLLHFQPFSVDCLKHFKHFMQKRHIFFLVTLSTLLQFASLIIMIISTSQLYVYKSHQTKNNCFFYDCLATEIYRKEITAYTAVTAVTIVLQLIYIAFIPTVTDGGDSKEILMTEKNSERNYQ